MSAQLNNIIEKFQEGFEKARQEMEEIKANAQNSLEETQERFNDNMKEAKESFYEFVAKVED